MKRNNNNTLTCYYCNKEHSLKKEDFDEIYEMIEKEEQKIEVNGKKQNKFHNILEKQNFIV